MLPVSLHSDMYQALLQISIFFIKLINVYLNKFSVTKEIKLLNRMVFLFQDFPVKQKYAFKPVVLCLCVIQTSSFLVS